MTAGMAGFLSLDMLYIVPWGKHLNSRGASNELFLSEIIHISYKHMGGTPVATRGGYGHPEIE